MGRKAWKRVGHSLQSFEVPSIGIHLDDIMGIATLFYIPILSFPFAAWNVSVIIVAIIDAQV